MYRWRIVQEDSTRIFLISENGDKLHYGVLEKGNILFKPFERNERIPEPIFHFYYSDGYEILQELANELSRVGFKVLATSDKVTEQTAIAEERKEQIQYLRNVIDEKLFSKFETHSKQG